MAISRMDMERQMRNMGGIMGLEDQRQGYFLGKLVKKVKKGVKKVVKSPLGKLALGAAALKFGGPGLAKLLGRPATGFLSGQFTGQGGIFNAARGLFDQGNLLAGLVRNPDGTFNIGRAALSGLGAASIAAPFFMGDEEEVDEGTPFTMAQPDIEDIRSQAKAYYSDPTNSALYFMPPKGAVQSSFYADGGLASLRPGYAGGQLVGPSGDGSRPGYAGESDIGILDVIKSFPSAVKQIFSGKTENMLGDNQEEKNKFMVQDMFPDMDEETFSMIVDMKNRGSGVDEISTITGQDPETITSMLSILTMKAYGGRIGKQEGGIMATDEASEMIDMGGMEKDYRNEGGFVAMGGKERADDVPARLSKNEFVFTADAVRNAGGGDIDKGAEVMENLMSNLEQGGEISEESQGLEGAQAMYDQQQMLQSRIV